MGKYVPLVLVHSGACAVECGVNGLQMWCPILRVECARGNRDVRERTEERSAKKFLVFIGDSALMFP